MKKIYLKDIDKIVDQRSLILHSMADNINVLDGIIKESAVTLIPLFSRIQLLELPPHRAYKLKHQFRHLSLTFCLLSYYQLIEMRSKRIRLETTKASDSRWTSGPYGVMDDCSSKSCSNHFERQAAIRDNCIIFTCHMHRRYSTSHSSGPKHGLYVSNALNQTNKNYRRAVY